MERSEETLSTRDLAQPDMESRLSRGASRISCFRCVVGGRVWSAGSVAARRAVRDAGQTDIRGSGWPQDHGSSWGAAV